jgi:hypothetical protein
LPSPTSVLRREQKMSKPRYLTKSRYKEGLSCPHKRFYTRKPQYSNTKLDDPFLQAPAQGGFQVEELARMQYPGGHLIEGNNWNYDLLVSQTNKLLEQENVIIYEPAFKHNTLFIRVDILVKRGTTIELIEAKSNAYDPFDEHLFRGKRGGLGGSWKPYVFDVAFLHHLMQQSKPNWTISSHLMLPNKKKEAKIEGVNQPFRTTEKDNNSTGINKKVESMEEIGASALARVCVDDIVADIQRGKYKACDEVTFDESVQLRTDHYQRDQKFNDPVRYSNCKGVEYRCSVAEEKQGAKSGLKECCTKQKGGGEAEFHTPNTFEVRNVKKGTKRFENSELIFLKEGTEEDVEVKSLAGAISL